MDGTLTRMHQSLYYKDEERNIKGKKGEFTGILLANSLN